MRNLLMFTSLNTNKYPFHFKSYTILREKNNNQLKKHSLEPVTSLAVFSFSSTWQKQ